MLLSPKAQLNDVARDAARLLADRKALLARLQDEASNEGPHIYVLEERGPTSGDWVPVRQHSNLDLLQSYAKLFHFGIQRRIWRFDRIWSGFGNSGKLLGNVTIELDDDYSGLTALR